MCVPCQHFGQFKNVSTEVDARYLKRCWPVLHSNILRASLTGKNCENTHSARLELVMDQIYTTSPIGRRPIKKNARIRAQPICPCSSVRCPPRFLRLYFSDNNLGKRASSSAGSSCSTRSSARKETSIGCPMIRVRAPRMPATREHNCFIHDSFIRAARREIQTAHFRIFGAARETDCLTFLLAASLAKPWCAT